MPKRMSRAAFEQAVRLSERVRERERIRKVVREEGVPRTGLARSEYTKGCNDGWNRALDSLEEKLKD